MSTRAFIRAAVVCCALAALVGPASATMPDLMTSCRAGDPPQCFVPVTEEWQGKYQTRCADAPERCSYRADGTISSWTGKMNPQAKAAMEKLVFEAFPPMGSK